MTNGADWQRSRWKASDIDGQTREGEAFGEKPNGASGAVRHRHAEHGRSPRTGDSSSQSSRDIDMRDMGTARELGEFESINRVSGTSEIDGAPRGSGDSAGCEGINEEWPVTNDQ